jgi:HEAT repeat protein
VCHGRYKYNQNITLYEILYGRKASKEQLVRLENQVAILFRFDNHPSHRFDFQEVKLNNLNHSIEINNIPIFWLDIIRIEESITFLEKCFNSKYIGSDKVKDTLVTAVGIHGPNPKAFNFLKNVLTGNYAAKVRKSAAFWISQQQSPEVAKVLERTVYNDRSSAVRENAVFGLYLVKCKEADDALVKLARKGKDKHVRKKAIFWLGQKAVKRTVEILEDMVNDDTDTDIQKAVVFAISQHPDGVSRLIKIAKTHRSLNVRKQAIFWLSQSDDPQALDTILDIIKN